MKLNKFIAPVITCSLIGSAAFDSSFAENFFPDIDIKISPGFGRIVKTGQSHTLQSDHLLKDENDKLKCKENYEKHPFEKISPDHRITLTDDAELQFTVEANLKDPVIFIYSKDKKLYCLQQRPDRIENLNSANFTVDGSVIVSHVIPDKNDGVIPAGTYLMWVGNPDGYETSYQLTIEEDDY